MEKQVEINNTGGIPTVSSLQIAKDFGKRHDNIIRDIEKLIEGINDLKIEVVINGLKIESVKKEVPMFIESSYIDKKGETRKYYEMTRDGFSLLAMGFTGKKALTWKLNYIEAFNLMETKLKEQPPKQTENITQNPFKALFDEMFGCNPFDKKNWRD